MLPVYPLGFGHWIAARSNGFNLEHAWCFLPRSWKFFLGPSMSFASLGLSKSLLDSISAEGYTEPTPIQTKAIPPILEGRDLMGCAQTGTGKTAAFALPVLQLMSQEPGQGGNQQFRTLVLSPTRELASQIYESFKTYGKNTRLRATVIHGGVSQDRQVRDLRRGVDIVVATPGRLMDLTNQGQVNFKGVNTLILDEADRMLDMGFLPDMKRIISLLPKERQTLFFSATMSPTVAGLAKELLQNPVEIRLAPEKSTTALISQSVYMVDKERRGDFLQSYIWSKHFERVLIFTRTKRGADRVSKQLGKSGINSTAMHGDKSQSQRQRILEGFKAGRPRILVATDLAARGIDIPGISLVVNYDLPMDPETYVHRIGRTGRAGEKGEAISFCSPEDRGLLREIEREIKAKVPLGTHRENPGSQAEPQPRPEHSEPLKETRSFETFGQEQGGTVPDFNSRPKQTERSNVGSSFPQQRTQKGKKNKSVKKKWSFQKGFAKKKTHY